MTPFSPAHRGLLDILSDGSITASFCATMACLGAGAIRGHDDLSWCPPRIDESLDSDRLSHSSIQEHRPGMFLCQKRVRVAVSNPSHDLPNSEVLFSCFQGGVVMLGLSRFAVLVDFWGSVHPDIHRSMTVYLGLCPQRWKSMTDQDK